MNPEGSPSPRIRWELMPGAGPHPFLVPFNRRSIPMAEENEFLSLVLGMHARKCDFNALSVGGIDTQENARCGSAYLWIEIWIVDCASQCFEWKGGSAAVGIVSYLEGVDSRDPFRDRLVLASAKRHQNIYFVRGGHVRSRSHERGVQLGENGLEDWYGKAKLN